MSGPRAVLVAVTLVLLAGACASDDPGATPSPSPLAGGQSSADPDTDGDLQILAASTRFEAVGGQTADGEYLEAEAFTYDAAASDCGIGETYGTPSDGITVEECRMVEGTTAPFIVAKLSFAERETDPTELWVACGAGDSFSPSLIALAPQTNIALVFSAVEEGPGGEAVLVSFTLPDPPNDFSLFFSVVYAESGEDCPSAFDLGTPFAFELDVGEQHGAARLAYAGGGEVSCVFRTAAAQWRASVGGSADQAC